MYLYIILNDKELPEPYGGYNQVCEAMEKLREIFANKPTKSSL